MAAEHTHTHTHTLTQHTHTQAIGLLDELDKELNTYAMRVREWCDDGDFRWIMRILD